MTIRSKAIEEVDQARWYPTGLPASVVLLSSHYDERFQGFHLQTAWAQNSKVQCGRMAGLNEQPFRACCYSHL